MNKQDLINFLTSFADSIDKEKQELYANVIESSGLENIETPDNFFFSVLYPWKNFLSAFIRSKISGNKDVEYLYLNSHVIDRHFQRQFAKYEGGACSADKSRTIVKHLLDFFLTGKKINFNYEQEYTFHLPKNIFKEHEDILNFYRAIKSLEYGDADKYIKELEKL